VCVCACACALIVLSWTFESMKVKDVELEKILYRCQTQGPRAECGPARSFYVAPDGLKDTWSPFLQEMAEKYPALLFWRFQIKSIYMMKLDQCSYVLYSYTRINHNQMQIELFNNILLCVLFWKFRIKLIYLIKLEKCSYVLYSYTWINQNQMQIELFNNILLWFYFEGFELNEFIWWN